MNKIDHQFSPHTLRAQAARLVEGLNLDRSDDPSYEDLLNLASLVAAMDIPPADHTTAETLRSALREEAQRSETYLAAYHSATDDLRTAQKLLDEARSREYHGDLEREAHGLQCGWPACAGKATLREAALCAMLVGEGWTNERIDACLAAREL